MIRVTSGNTDDSDDDDNDIFGRGSEVVDGGNDLRKSFGKKDSDELWMERALRKSQENPL